MYLLKLAFRTWKQTPVTQVSCVLAGGFLFFLFSLALWMQQQMGPVIARLQSEQVVIAYLDPMSTVVRDSDWVDRIKTQVGAASLRVEYKDSTAFVNDLGKNHPELLRELQDFGSEMNQIAPSFVSFQGQVTAPILDAIRRIPGVESVETSSNRYKPIVEAFSAIRRIAFVLSFALFAAGLGAFVFFSRLNQEVHSEVVALLKLWGSERWKLRAPSLISDGVNGVFAGVVAMVLWLSLGTLLLNEIRVLSPVFAWMSPPHVMIILIAPVLGGALAVLGSLVVLRK